MKSGLVIFGAALRDFGRSAGALVGYELLLRLASFVAIAPVISWILRSIVETSGRYAIGNTELLAFFLSPAGVATVIVSAVLFLFGLFVQLAGALLIADGRTRGRPRSPIAAAWGVLRAMPALLRLGMLQVLRYATVVIPGLAVVGIAYLALWSKFDLYFLTTTRPPVFWSGVVLAGLVAIIVAALALRLTLGWLVALPVMLLESRAAGDAMRVSVERTRGRGWRNLGALSLWAVALVVLGLAASAGFHLLSEPLLSRTSGSLSTAIPAIGGLLALHLLVFVSIDILGGIGLALVLYRIHQSDVDPVPIASASPDPDPKGLGLWPGTIRFRRKVLIGVMSLVILAVAACLGMLATIGVSPSVTITAHRGGSKAAPENTRAAIRGAIASGADSAEIDVQLSADGVVIVFHDEDLMRLANDPRRVAGLDFEELRRIDVGAWFGPEFRGERIPTLDEILDDAGDRLRLNIELKMTRGERDPVPLVRGVLDALDRKEARGRCVISSLSYEALAEVRRQAPDLKIGFIIFESVGDPTRLDLDFLSVREPIATDDLIARAGRRGWPVHVWTVNDPGRLATLIDRGVADILTSDPAVMVARREELAGLGDLDRLLLWYRRALIDGPRIRLDELWSRPTSSARPR